MKIFILTKGRYNTITSHRYFPTATVVVHNKAEANAYLTSKPELKGRLVISGVSADTFGLTRQREFVCKNLVEPNEWFVFADDNIRHLLCCPEPTYSWDQIKELVELHTRIKNRQGRDSDTRQKAKYYRDLLNTRLSADDFLTHIVPDTIQQCERVKAHIAGFSPTDNIVFRYQKFHNVAYVIGKLQVWQNEGVPFDHTISMEDFYHTAEHIKRFGFVVRNNYVAVACNHYQAGGMGTYAERKEQRKRDVAILMARYPGMYRIVHRVGFEWGTDLQLVLRTREQVQDWIKRQNRNRLF